MTVLVTGATGLVGRALVDALLAAGAHVRAVSRSGRQAGLPIEDIVADADDLTGLDVIFVHPRAIGMDAAELVRRAGDAGVQRLVVLSAINVDEALERQPSRLRGDRNAEVETAVVAGGLACGLEVVVLRCSEFASNSFGTIGAQLRLGDVVRGAHPQATEATIDERDIGEVAAHAMLRDDLAGRQLVLTGPQALTLPERVELVAAAIGRRLRFLEVDSATAATGLLAAGLPRSFAENYLAVQAERVRSPATVTKDVAEVLGRPARTFATWAVDHAYRFAVAATAR